jgi:hypothetical protein
MPFARGSFAALGGKARMKDERVGTLFEGFALASGRQLGEDFSVCGCLRRLFAASFGSKDALSADTVFKLGQVAPFGARLRSALVSGTVGGSLFAGQRGVGVNGRFPDA